MANFQGLYNVFRSYVIPMRMKTSAKKSQHLSRSESDKKEHLKLPILFCSKVSYYLVSKDSKVSNYVIAFMVLDRFLGGLV